MAAGGVVAGVAGGGVAGGTGGAGAAGGVVAGVADGAGATGGVGAGVADGVGATGGVGAGGASGGEAGVASMRCRRARRLRLMPRAAVPTRSAATIALAIVRFDRTRPRCSIARPADSIPAGGMTRTIQSGAVARRFSAGVAKLVDAPALGAGGLTLLGVRVPSPASIDQRTAHRPARAALRPDLRGVHRPDPRGASGTRPPGHLDVIDCLHGS